MGILGMRGPKGTIRSYKRPDDAPFVLDEAENLILLQIRLYFMLQWSKHYQKFDEHLLMNRIQYVIAEALKQGALDPKLNLCNFVPAQIMLTNRPVPRNYLEAHLVAVANWLVDKMRETPEWRALAYRKRLED